MSTVLVIHGPNLNLLGTREPEHYGSQTLDDINQLLMSKAQSAQISFDSFQSNHEGAIVDRIHLAVNQKVDFIIINPAAFTHSSVAIRDALLGTNIPFIEVHLSNIHAREEFRKHSFYSDVALGVISGFGAHSYVLALEAIINQTNP